MAQKDIVNKIAFFHPASYLLRGWVCVFLGFALLLSHFFNYSQTTVFLIGLAILVSGGELFLRGELIELKNGYCGFNAFISTSAVSVFLFGVVNNYSGNDMLKVSGFYLLLPFILGFANFIKSRELSQVNRSFKFMDMLDNFISKSAYLMVDGKPVKVFAAEVKIGQSILIQTGDRVPLDCVITQGKTIMDEKLLTGNITLTAKKKGDSLYAGSINKGADIYAQVTAVRGFTKMAKIVKAVKESEHKKLNIISPLEHYCNRYFIFFIIVGVVLAGIAFYYTENYYYAISTLLCFIALSGPVTYMLAVLLPMKFVKTSALRHKIKINNIHALEAVYKATKFFIDKTGTLTTARLEVAHIGCVEGVKAVDLIKAAVTAQCDSNNIFGDAICTYAQKHKIKAEKVLSVQLYPSYGTLVRTAKDTILSGRKTWLLEQGVDVPAKDEDSQKTVFYISKSGVYLGCIYFTDKLRANAKNTIDFLHNAGKAVCLVSGDNAGAVAYAAKKCNIEEYYGDMYPHDKAAKISAQENMGQRVVMVGDGFNDILALLQANACIAFTFSGNAFTGWVDIALNGKDFNGIKTVFTLYRKQYLIIRQNIYISVLFSLGVLYGVIAGNYFNQWYNLLGFIMISILFIILNSARILR